MIWAFLRDAEMLSLGFKTSDVPRKLSQLAMGYIHSGQHGITCFPFQAAFCFSLPKWVYEVHGRTQTPQIQHQLDQRLIDASNLDVPHSERPGLARPGLASSTPLQ